jgi:murein DD-endopeptidase MepM/ murein hydrolase activator NlpD
MRVRRGVLLSVAVAVVFLTLAGPAGAEVSMTAATTTVPSTSSTPVTTTAAAVTETQSGTTAAATDTTGASPATDTTASPAVGATAPVAVSIDHGCVLGGVALLLPNRAPLLLGPLATAPTVQVAGLSRLAYPDDGSVVSASAISLEETGCSEGRSADGQAQLRSLSLFAGAITATTVTLMVDGTSVAQTGAIGGLEVDGTPISASAGTRVPVEDWGYLITGARQRHPAPPASSASEPLSRLRASALAVHLVKPHAGLPAGAVLLVAFAEVPAQTAGTPSAPSTQRLAGSTSAPRLRGAAKVKRAHTRQPGARLDRPLMVTPPLGLQHYVFPVAGPSEFVDSYGAFRSDVSGNWHHGDDIFAPLGTPVVAVASGTLNQVGWEQVGGWRLWVRDSLGNEFYYAHLSGYAPAALRSNQVTGGEVIGFVGNTGDAFTTPPHLHFEIHPRTLLPLHYDGAVDPTTYLDRWTHPQHVYAPRPVHPPLPAGAIRQEARYVFRELLVARHLIKHPPRNSGPPRIQPPSSDSQRLIVPRPARRPAIAPTAPRHHPQPPSTTTLALSVGIGALALFALSMLVLLAHRHKPQPSTAEAGSQWLQARQPDSDSQRPNPPEPAHHSAITPAAPTHHPTPLPPLRLALLAGTGALALFALSTLVLPPRRHKT